MPPRRRPISAPPESAVPDHQLAPLTADDGTVLRGARVEMAHGIPRRANVIEAIRARGETRVTKGGLPTLTDAHAGAAMTFRNDWTDVGGGVGPSRSDMASEGLHGGRIGPAAAMLAQLALRTRLEGAMAHVGALIDVMVPVVAQDVPLAVWARQYEAAHARLMTEDMAKGRLIAALERLVEYYDARADGS